MKIPSPSEVLPVIRERQETEDNKLTKACVQAIRGMSGGRVQVQASGCTYTSIQRVVAKLAAQGWKAKHFTGDQREPCSLIWIEAP